VACNQGRPTIKAGLFIFLFLYVIESIDQRSSTGVHGAPSP